MQLMFILSKSLPACELWWVNLVGIFFYKACSIQKLVQLEIFPLYLHQQM